MGDQFPAGLRVLVVDDDRTCLAIVEKMLLSCAYNVTTCGMARRALALLRENKERFDVVLSDVCMPDMDGFKLLELVGLEMDLPVIMMSANGETSLVMKGITHGACDYLLKPIRIKELKNIWQHVIRRRRNVVKESDGGGGDLDRNRRKSDEGDSAPATGSASAAAVCKKRKEPKEDEDELDLDMDDSNTLKKPRVVWSVELHQQFVTAVNQLGIDKAVPKRILELMNVQGLTRENVASHLQKYRLYLKRLSVAQHQNAVMPIGSEPSYSAIDTLQPHPIISPGSSQALAALRSAYLRTLCSSNDPASTNGVVDPPVLVVRPRGIPANNQRNLLLGVGDIDQQHHQQSQITQIRSVQEGLLSPSNPLSAEQIIHQQHQQQQQHQHQHQQQHTQIQLLQPYDQKNDTFTDYPHYNNSDSAEMVPRNTALDEGGIIGRGFGGGIVASATGDGMSVLMSTELAKQPNVPGMGVVKCEQTDSSSLGGWDGGNTAGAGVGYAVPGQLTWQEQQQQQQQQVSQGFIHDSVVAYGSTDSHEYLGLMNCPRIIPACFKVKQEQGYDPVINQFQQGAGHHSHDELVGLHSYKQEQESHGFLDNDLCLEGYAQGNNLYVK